MASGVLRIDDPTLASATASRNGKSARMAENATDPHL
jgi:hypothetical protein